MALNFVRAQALGFLIITLFAAPRVSAGELISVAVDGVERISGSNFVDLVEDALSQQSAFQDLAGQPSYEIAVDYLGITRAIVLDASSNGSVVTLSIPSIGFSQLFTGTNADDVENQVGDFFEQNGSDTLAKFLEEVNGRSPLAVTDGNPRSTTALLARSAFDRFGFGAPRSRAGYRQGKVAEWGHFDLQVETSGGSLKVDGFDSYAIVDGALTLAGDFEPGVGISFSVIGQYRDLDGSDVFDGGLELGVPIRILAATKNGALRWVVTPFVQAGAGVAVDLAAGGLMMGGGAVSSLSYNFAAFEVAMANEVAYYGGIPIKNIGGYEFDTDLDRLILRNGAKLAYHMTENASIEGGVSVTNFLINRAAVDYYTTPFAGAAVQVGVLRLRVGWESDFGKDFVAHIGKAEVALEF